MRDIFAYQAEGEGLEPPSPKAPVFKTGALPIMLALQYSGGAQRLIANADYNRYRNVYARVHAVKLRKAPALILLRKRAAHHRNIKSSGSKILVETALPASRIFVFVA